MEWPSHDLVFTRRLGEPAYGKILYAAFSRVLKRTGNSVISFHDMRHTFATHAMQSRVNPKVVTEVLGHASVAFTLDRYSHHVPGLGSDATTIVERLFRAPEPPVEPSDPSDVSNP